MSDEQDNSEEDLHEEHCPLPDKFRDVEDLYIETETSTIPKPPQPTIVDDDNKRQIIIEFLGTVVERSPEYNREDVEEVIDTVPDGKIKEYWFEIMEQFMADEAHTLGSYPEFESESVEDREQ